MTHKALSEILARQAGGTSKGNRLELPTAAELTLFAAFADEGLQVERVRAVELENEYVVVHTAKQERFVLLYEDIRAVRVASGQASAGYAA
jgi:hypothetical protein